MADICNKCGLDLDTMPIGYWPFCKGNPEDHKPGGSYNAQGDECDVWMKHGLCNEDGTPKHYTSREQIRKDAEKAGLTNVVRHIGLKGSDKSPFTSRWV